MKTLFAVILFAVAIVVIAGAGVASATTDNDPPPNTFEWGAPQSTVSVFVR
jgi:hypothetical protein